MTRFLLIGILVNLLVFTAGAQGKANSLKGVSAKERFVPVFGGGLSFGPYQDYASVSLGAGYMVTKRFIPGVSVSYAYIKYKDVLPGRDLSTSNVGVSPWLRFMISPKLFLHTEYEYLSYEVPQPDLSTIRMGYESAFIGAGYVIPVGDNGAINFIALYNLAYKDPRTGEFYPYDTPLVLRAWFSIGNFSF